MPTSERLAKLSRVAAQRQQGVVVLENIADKHNAGAVFRSCEAFGIQEVRLIFSEEAPFSAREVKTSSASANGWLTVSTYTSTEEALAPLKAEGYQLVGTVLNEAAKTLDETKLTSTPKLALLFGNEHRGLTQTAQTYCDSLVYVPMRGIIQSLNLSVTAALCLYELTRQRQAQGLDSFLLSPAQQTQLLQQWGLLPETLTADDQALEVAISEGLR